MNPSTILVELWDAGVSIELAPDGVNLAAPAGRLTPSQRDFVKANKPALINFLVQARATTSQVIAAAMRRCDEFNDSDQAREEMRQQCMELSPAMQADLLAHFQGKPVKFPN